LNCGISWTPPVVRRLFPLVVLLAVASGCGAAPSGLKQTTLPNNAGTVELPGNWRFRDASYPSDHATWFWYDPTDSFAKLRIVASGCGGCVSRNNDGVTPYPQGEMPQFATVTASPDPYTVTYQVFDTPYADDGMVIVTHTGSTITGSLIFDLWLPTKRHAEAAQILASFQEGH
jgi:hypothetical protein